LTKIRKPIAQAVKAQRKGDRANARHLLDLAIARLEELNQTLHTVQQATKGK
jgi:hypothetical protein